MKELTAAQGLLRCGECDTIFDAMKALTTTLPEERSFSDSPSADKANNTNLKPADTRIRVLPANQASGHKTHGKPRVGSSHSTAQHSASRKRSRKLLWLSLTALAGLLLLQLLYTSRHWFMAQPATANIAQQLCAFINCETQTLRDVEKISVLSKSVYSHPNSPELLIVSASFQNDAAFAQPYPLLEISFFNSSAGVVAMRRFKPEEYMTKKKAGHMMPTGAPEEFSVHISDPGPEAVNFQLRFF